MPLNANIVVFGVMFKEKDKDSNDVDSNPDRMKRDVLQYVRMGLQRHYKEVAKDTNTGLQI